MSVIGRGWHARRPALNDAALAVVAAGTACWVAPPFRLGSVGSDAASTVVYFQRIIRGERLERFLGTAPKPLLSLIYGPIYELTHDWRAISALAIVVYALAITATARLARRIGGRGAAAACTVGLLASNGLLQDMALSYTIGWALLSWSLAGLAVTARVPRYDLAGAALLVGGLARQETWFITVGALIALGAHRVTARRCGREPPPRAAWQVAIGLGAIPVLAVHDWLLTGDAAYSYRTPRLGSEIRPPQDPATAGVILRTLADRTWPLLVAGLVGIAVLVARRCWPVLIGLTALGPGVAAFLLAQGNRGIYVLHRYALPAEVAIIVAGAIGIGAAVDRVGVRRGVDRTTWWPAISVVAALILGALLAPAHGPFDDAGRAWIATDRQLIEDFTVAAPSIASALATLPESPAGPIERDASDVDAPVDPDLLVPARVFPMATAQFDLSLTEIDRLVVAAVDPAAGYPAPGQLALITDVAPSALANPAPELMVRFVDRVRRVWVVSVDGP